MSKRGLGRKSSYVVLGGLFLCGLAFSQVTHDSDAKVTDSSRAWQTEREPQVFDGNAKPTKAGQAVARPISSHARLRPAAPIVGQDRQPGTEPDRVEIRDGVGVRHVVHRAPVQVLVGRDRRRGAPDVPVDVHRGGVGGQTLLQRGQRSATELVRREVVVAQQPVGDVVAVEQVVHGAMIAAAVGTDPRPPMAARPRLLEFAPYWAGVAQR